MVLKQRNRSIQGFISRNFKSLLFVVIFLFLLGGSVHGAGPFIDDFDSYTGFDLNDNSDWEDCQGYASFQISTTTNYSEPNSAYAPASASVGRCSEKTGDQITTGSLSFWTRISGGAGAQTRIILYGEAEKIGAFMFFETGGDVGYYNGSDWIDICSVDDDVWFWSLIEWDSATNKVKYTCESIEQTSGWVFPPHEGIDYILKVRMVGAGNHPNTYFDDFGPLCQIYEVYETCISGGCMWYYSIYLQQYYCVEPFTPDAEDCGSFFKCQHCLTQTPCEAELNCEWVDIGYGNKCYMVEPTIPPPQADWEVPDIESCSGLSGAELWLCKIKNMIAGVFMPSATTTEALYQTIGAFKEKFPFNYISSLNYFLTNVSEGLEATTTIPIEILGATSTIDFTFWNSTTTIGGEEETFKNILYDFTTFVILMCWFVWLISLIKRFF